MNPSLDSRWTLNSAKLGAILWVILAVLGFSGRSGLGVIALLFLLAPLVVVPLGFELLDAYADGMRPAALGRAIRIVQPPAAIMAAASFLFPAGRVAGALATGWLALAALVAVTAIVDLMRGGWRSLERLVFDVARFDLAVGGCWFLTSRFAVTPMGFREPIVLLTGMHFHFSGYATALLAGIILRAFRFHDLSSRRIARWVVVCAVFVPYLLAAGFVLSAALKLIFALVLAFTLLAFAVLQLSVSARCHSRLSRTLLRISGGLLIPGMLLVIVYACGEYTQRSWLLIPQMARLHGPLNGPGFVLLGVLAWLTEARHRPLRLQPSEDETRRVEGQLSHAGRMS